jgi:hypothetical protein
MRALRNESEIMRDIETVHRLASEQTFIELQRSRSVALSSDLILAASAEVRAGNLSPVVFDQLIGWLATLICGGNKQ